jgi:hypothetical protein
VLIACVLRSGGIYDHEWVNRLYDGVRRNWDLDRKLNFICLSDAKWSAPYHIAPMHDHWPGYWSKLELFHPGGPFQSHTLYLDLDCIINGPMSMIAGRPMLNAERGFRVMRDPNTKDLQSAVMRWTSQWAREWGRQVYATFRRNPDLYMREFAHTGDQGFIADTVRYFDKSWSYFTEVEVTSYKAHWLGKPDPVSCVVQCHGEPKPHQLPTNHPLRLKWECVL